MVADTQTEHLTICTDDLTSTPTRALLAVHLRGMHANSPPDSVHALDLSGLQGPDVTVWSAWYGPEIAGIGALKILSPQQAEIKSMRVHPDHLRRGVGRAILRHILSVARERGLAQVSLETGSGPAFDPAIALYRAHGFAPGPVFGAYARTAFNQFFHLPLV